MKVTVWPILVITLIIASCERTTTSTENKATSLKYLGEVVLSHDDLLLSNRGALSKVVGQDSLLIYDQQSKQLVIFDLKKKIPIHTITVTLDGPDFFDLPFVDLAVQNDSLFILSHNYFSIFNMDGKTLLRIDKNELSDNNLSPYLNDFQLLDRTKILFSKVPMDVMVSNFQSPEKPKLFFTLDLPTGAVSEIPVFSPKESLIDDETLGYYNDNGFHSMVINYDSIIYSFPFTSKVFIYDMGTNEQTEIEAPSKYVENLRTPINSLDNNNSEKWAEYMYSSSKFSAIEKDNKTGIFIRVATQFKKLTDGESRSYKYLMLMNGELEVIEEIEVKAKVFPSPIVSNGIIYLPKVDQPLEDAYSFVAYEIVK
ncbi:hypothetical protein ACV07N_00330 [Roseivirga echinicomitans]